MKELIVYPGDNGQQEFFEDAESNISIIRNHGDKERLERTENRDRGWWVHGNDPQPAWFEDKEAPKEPGRHVSLGGTIKEVLQKLEKQYEIKATINLSKMWIHPRKGAKTMKLEDTREAPEQPCPRCSSRATGHWHPKAGQSVVNCDHCGYVGFGIVTLWQRKENESPGL